MFNEIVQFLNRGQEVKAYGEIYIVLYYLSDGYCLAAKKYDGCPANVYCIKKDDEEKKEEGEPDFGKCERCGEDLVALDYRNGEPTECHQCKVKTGAFIA